MNILTQFLLIGGVNEPVDSTRIASVSVTIGLKDGVPHFSASGFSLQQGRGMSSGIVLNTGDVDVSNMGTGDVTFTIRLDDEAWRAGYRFPSDAHQAVAIVYYPPNSPTAPDPVFGTGSWPAEFGEPGFSDGGKNLVFIDKDDNSDAYEYSVALNGPGGRVVLDPKIKNGGNN